MSTKLTPVVKDYLELTEKFRQKYKNPVILYQVGGFYELYADKENKNFLAEVCSKLNMIMTKKDKKRDDSPYMAGFPQHSLEKYKELLGEEYTVIIVNQHEVGKNKYERRIDEIITPGSYYGFKDYKNKYIAYITIEKSKKQMYAAVSVIDVNSNELVMKEFPSFSEFSEITEWLEDKNDVKEIYVSSNSLQAMEEFEKEVKNGRLKNAVLNMKEQKKEPPVEKVVNFLKDVYPNIEDDISLIMNKDLMFNLYYLLNVIKEINPFYLRNLSYPEIVKNKDRFILANHSAVQLNITDPDETKYSMSRILMSACSTAIGKRYMYKRLLSPFFDAEKIKKSYEQIDKFKKNAFYETVEEELKNVYDIERIVRKMDIKRIQPYEMFMFYKSFLAYKKILEKLLSNEDFRHPSLEKSLSSLSFFLDFFNSLFNVPVLEYVTGDYSSVLSFIDDNKNYNGMIVKTSKELKDIVDEIKSEKEKILKLQKFLKEYNIKIEKGREEYFFKIGGKNTEKETVNKILSKIKELKIDYETKNLKSGTKIELKEEKLYILENRYVQKSKEIFEEEAEKLNAKYKKLFKVAIEYIRRIDFYKAGAKIARQMGYVKPQIIEADEAFLHVEDIRHPIVEYIGNTLYIGNDLTIDKENKGYLIYGVNSSGKSTLMKSVGVNLILAQAGLFVSAKSFVYSPFKSIFTRILGNDRIYSGESSFEVEMNELKEILAKADKNSIVLGDELAKGTETVSAISIVAAGLERLMEKGAKIIFSTHLHELSRMENIISLPLKICHLSIGFKNDPELKGKDRIIYERKLKEGSGKREYGIEIAEAMGLDDKFIKRSYEIRTSILLKDNLLKEDLNRLKEYDLKKKKSKYNKDVEIGGKCEICGKRIATEVHHIIPQKEFEKGQEKKKNAKANLIAICDECHKKIHKGEL